uniref:ATP-grasp domain-containing protein n=1 Tax=Hanusia phi TaxID=3032 RepID=A0A7S0I1C0_9CRYP|mmetsp:Transcript_7945/g.18113  ORF Transcript_7945/g.18113 Transcript_7945/m.18113 type:complete len:461 (+) Transcript_7945:116-1498(+)|eukprot:753404-Hanusia_phi.AAC.4
MPNVQLEGDVGLQESIRGKTLLVVTVGNATRFDIYKRLHDLDVDLYCLNDRVVNECRSFFKGWIVVDMQMEEKTLLQEVHRRMDEIQLQPDGVICFDEFGIEVSSMICESLGMPCIPLQIVRCCRNKSKFRDFCKERSLPTVRFLQFSSLEQLHDIDERISFPAVFKPKNGAGSQFVQRVNNKEELYQAYFATVSSLQLSSSSYLWCSPTGPEEMSFHVEELIEGQEVDVDCVVFDSKLRYSRVIDNESTGGPFFLEAGCSAPSSLPQHAQTSLIRMAERIVAEFAREANRRIDGVLHVEAKWTSRGAVPIEVNCRLGGAECRCMHMAGWGVDLGVEEAMVALGRRSRTLDGHERQCRLLLQEEEIRTPLKEKKQEVFLRSVNFHPGRSGRIVSQSIPEDAEGYVDHKLFYTRGEEVKVPPRGFQYLGWMVVRGGTEEEARLRLEHAVKLSSLCVEDTAT